MNHLQPFHNAVLKARTAWYKTVGSVHKKPALLTIVNYHDIANDNWPFSVSLQTFAEQMEYFSTLYEFISMDTAVDWLSGKTFLQKPSMVITFDDGFRSILQAVDIVKHYSIKPTLFVLSDPEQANMNELDRNTEFLTWADIKKLERRGWLIGCHSATHPDFGHLDKKNLKKEIRNAKRKIEYLLDNEVKYFAYPKGMVTNRIEYAVREAEFTAAFTTDDKLPHEVSNIFRIPRVCIDSSNPIEGKMMVMPSVIKLRRTLAKIPGLRYIRYAAPAQS